MPESLTRQTANEPILLPPSPVTKVLRDAQCRVGTTCPRIEPVEGGYDIVGTEIPDQRIAATERKVRVPATMLPELANLDIQDFAVWLSEHRKTPGDMLRIQTLDAYEVESDGGDFAAYLQGGAGPPPAHSTGRAAPARLTRGANDTT
jgi:hypothetical protein